LHKYFPGLRALLLCVRNHVSRPGPTGSLESKVSLQPGAEDSLTNSSCFDHASCDRGLWRGVGRARSHRESRKAKTKDGRPTEFWSPNFLGRLYQSATLTEAGNRSGPTQRLHWRRGHIKSQPHGLGHLYIRAKLKNIEVS